MNILITGSGGFLGRSLCSKLSNEGHKVLAIDNNTRGNLNNLENHKNITKKKIDILNYNSLKRVFKKKFDIVFHLAAINGTENFYKIPDKVLETGIIGTYNIIKLTKRFKVPKFVFASSSEVYNQPDHIPTTEEAKILIPDIKNERFSYSGSKIAGELLTINLLRESKTNYLIFRPHNVIGPQMGFEHVIPQITKKFFDNKNLIEKNKRINLKIQGGGKTSRSFIYIDDFSEALILSSQKKINNEIINIGNSKEIKIEKVINIISKYLGAKIIIKNTPLPKGGPLRRCPDIKKLRKIKFKPIYTNKKSIEKTVDWYWRYFNSN